jgi:hypothetical protein
MAGTRKRGGCTDAGAREGGCSASASKEGEGCTGAAAKETQGSTAAPKDEDALLVERSSERASTLSSQEREEGQAAPAAAGNSDKREERGAKEARRHPENLDVSETIITSKKHAFPDASEEEGGADGEDGEEEQEGESAVAAAPGGATVGAVCKKMRKKVKKARQKLKKHEEEEVSMQNVANFRLTMSMDTTYKGVIHFIIPGNDRGSVLIESTLLMGFFSIPAGRICALGQTVLVRMRPPLVRMRPADASFAGVTSLQVELV